MTVDNCSICCKKLKYQITYAALHILIPRVFTEKKGPGESSLAQKDYYHALGLPKLVALD